MISHSDFEFRISAACRRGFTLTELLVVIGIITILIGILLPTINRVRRVAYVADTQNEISQLSNACNQYYTTFHAYPGPLSNDQIEDTSKTAPPPWEFYIGGNYSPMGSYLGTGAENLVLGLMGGLRLDQNTPSTINGQNLLYTLVFAPSEVGLGPLSLSSSYPGRTASFFPTGSNYLMWCQLKGATVVQNTQYQANLTPTLFTDAAGTQAVQTSPIPVFVDRFPAPGPLPILYLRARTGAKGVVSVAGLNEPAPPVGTGAPALYQYDIRDINAYTLTHIGLPPKNQWGKPVFHNLIGIGSSFAGSVTIDSAINNSKNPGSPGAPLSNAGLYFVNQSIPPTGADPNYTGRPRAVDQFILISAGPDGIYGTSDDITSFGDVSQ